MTSLLRYSNDETFMRLKRKVALRAFRSTMGDLEREAKKENSMEQRVDIKEFLKNPQEIYSKQNVAELESKLKDIGNLQREYIDDVGLNQVLLEAPTNDVDSLKASNAAALKFDNMLSPDPSLIAQQSTAKSLEEKSRDRKKILRDQRRQSRMR